MVSLTPRVLRNSSVTSNPAANVPRLSEPRNLCVRVVKTGPVQRRTQRFVGSESRGTFAAGFEVTLEFRSTRGVKLTIEIPVKNGSREITAHGKPPAERRA